MTHADAFLRDILAHPDDDAPRLIFADWLEEQGDANSVARAEFIRVQCALADGSVPQQRREELQRRKREILEEYNYEWARPLRRLVRSWKYHRGFIDEVVMSPNLFFAHADRLFRLSPIQHLHLWPRQTSIVTRTLVESVRIAELAENQHLDRLRSLDLGWNRLESRDLCALIVSHHLTNLTTLDLSHNLIGNGGIRALAASPLMGRLQHLSLRSNDIGADGLRALEHALEELDRSAEGVRLRRLELSRHNFSTGGQRVIADSPLLRRLVRWCD